jgi:hypothetical protein
MATKKKSKQVVGALPKMQTVELTYPHGHTVVENMDHAVEALQVYEDTMAVLKPVLESLEMLKLSATTYAARNDTPDVIQLETSYWRKIQRFGRKWIGTPEDMPDPKPKGAKSLQELCKGKVIQRGKKTTPLWVFITTRVVDPDKINAAVELGAISEKEVQKAFVEYPQKPFIQRFEGEAKD